MDTTKKGREELKGFFKRNAVPKEGEFAHLIDAAINQKDDGLIKSADGPLELAASKTDMTAIKFYENIAAADPAWLLNLRDDHAAVGSKGLAIRDKGGSVRLSIDSATGTVGVGTLTASGAITANGGITVGAGKTLSINAPVTLGDSVTANEGLTVPAGKVLSVEGSINLGTTSRQAINLSGTSYGIGTQAATVYLRSPKNFALYAGGSHAAGELAPGGGAAHFVVANGNIGVGTSTPQAKFQVVGGAIMPAVGTDESSGILFPRDPGGGGSDRAFIRYSAKAPTIETTTLRIGIDNDPDDVLALWQMGADRLIIRNGNVGIGTADPASYMLRVGGSVLVDTSLTVVGALNANGTLYTRDASVQGTLNADSGLNVKGLLSYHGGKLTLRLREHKTKKDANGNVLYYAALHVEGVVLTNHVRTSSLSAKGGKTFEIDHPLDPAHKNLVHGCLEGPELGVYYRGEAQLTDGRAVIALPSYFEALTRKENRTVTVTPRYEGDEPISALAASKIVNGRCVIRAIDHQNPSQRFYWEIKAVRADVPELQVERAKTAGAHDAEWKEELT
ncbi:MAG: hypothetical protein HUU21_11510 [Polyangiaceae bacterium]|nr:hypothetical protein [Polyangiaceae bacterium]